MESTRECNNNISEDVSSSYETRLKYLNLNASLQEQLQSADCLPLEVIYDTLYEANTLFSEVTSPTEAVEDSKIIKTCSAHLKDTTSLTHHGMLQFDHLEFADKLNAFEQKYQPTDLFIGLGQGFSDILNRAYGTESLNFSFNSDLPENVQPLKRGKKDNDIQKDIIATQVELSKDENMQEMQVGEVSRLFRILQIHCKQNKGQILYYEFVINPNSFMHTIENIYHAAFLVDKEKAFISEVNNKPYIGVVTSSTSKFPSKNQLICTINMDKWEKLIEEYGIVNPKIPPRAT